jgi:hypothetical protein
MSIPRALACRCRPLTRLVAVALVLAGLAAPGGAQTSAKSALDPGAVAALDRMGAYLRSLKAFQVRAATITEDVLEDGQKVQYASTTDLVATRTPDRLRAEVSSDRQERLYLYDGREFTLFAKRLGFYATTPAPPTLGELTDRLEERYDIEVPLVDLFKWGPSSSAGITGAVDLGPSEVSGVTCRQYAFRQDGLDWQIWIQLGDYPLPRRLVATTTSDEARPQFTASYDWNLAPSFSASAFTFAPPADARRIVFAAETAPAGATR